LKHGNDLIDGNSPVSFTAWQQEAIATKITDENEVNDWEDSARHQLDLTVMTLDGLDCFAIDDDGARQLTEFSDAMSCGFEVKALEMCGVNKALVETRWSLGEHPGFAARIRLHLY